MSDGRKPMKYWQCPNDESHTLHHSNGRYAGSPRCVTCKVEAIMDIHPSLKVAPPEASHD